jgi:hypothetical protein
MLFVDTLYSLQNMKKGHPCVQRQHMHVKAPRSWTPHPYFNNGASKYQCYSKRPAVLQVPTSSLKRNVNRR